MAPDAIFLLSVVALLAAMIGVITGGNTLITVPVMIGLGMAPRSAVASNMLAITFLSLSGGVRLLRAGPLRWDLFPPLAIVTLATSWYGAFLAGELPEKVLGRIVVVSMLPVLVIVALQPRLGAVAVARVSRLRVLVGMLATALLGVYGGLFSGGYTTLVTLVAVALLGASLMEAVTLSKWINFVSSAIAAFEFGRRGLIDYRVALPMAAAMSLGAWLGARWALVRSFEQIRRLFVIVVALLSLKLFWDLIFAG